MISSKHCTAIAAALSVVVPGTHAQTTDHLVEARIEIPEAEVYVLGDDIPIVWEFVNRSTNSVAMLWEGCCRLNGKLNITSDGQPVEILPPGAASYHSYTKAEELKVDTPEKFSSLLSDWVRLPRGGSYKIGGRYTGVLPTQTPQVAEDLALWRGTATASPEDLQVMAVSDYLDQRDSRTAERGWRLTVTSDQQEFPALDELALKVTIENVSNEERTFAWPGATQLWFVDQQGLRLSQATKQIRLPGEEFALRPGDSVTRTLNLSSTDLNGEPFGLYDVFLDLAATDNEQPRVPSNSIQLAWNLSPAQLAALLNQAGGGPSVGMRNPALKLLRVHLNEIAPRLADLNSANLTEAANTLRNELRLAACLQPISPKPGRTVLQVEIQPDGSAALEQASTPDCGQLNTLAAVQQLESIYDVRRHLGWDIGVEINAPASTELQQIFDFVGRLDESPVELSGSVTHSFSTETGRTNVVQFFAQPVGANVIVRMNEALEVAAKKPVPGRPVWMNAYAENEIASVRTQPVDADQLVEWINAQGISTPRLLVMAEGQMSWETFRFRLDPLWDVTPQISVVQAMP